jgi:hypothetical protein
MQKNIFLDLDGLKFDTLDAHVAYMNWRYGINSKPSDYLNNPPLQAVVNSYLPAEKHVTREEVYADSGKNFLSSIEWHKDVLPFEDMCEVLPELAKKYRLWTVTARQKGGLHVVKYLLNKYIPNCIYEIHCVWEYVDNEFRDIPKKQFISSVSGEKIGFIDDTPHEVIELQPVLPSYLFDPTGINDSHPHIKNRVRSWKEIGELFL